jgi:hypothetical protein
MPTNGEMVPSLSRVQRTLAADIAYTISRMKVLERIPSNPIGIDYRWVDETAVALTARLLPFCRVIGLRAGHEAHIEPLVAWYRDHGVKPAFEMVPGHYDEGLGRELARLAFYQSRFHVSLIGEPAQTADADGRITIERVTGSPSMEAYLDAYVAGWELLQEDHAQFKTNGRSMSDARTASRPPPRRSICTTASATSRTQRPIPPSAGRASSPPCCDVASTTPARRAPISCLAAPRRFRPATATWSAPACGCSSYARCGPRCKRQRLQELARPRALFMPPAFGGPQMTSIVASAMASSAGRPNPARA